MKIFITMLFALLLALASRDAITTTPKGNSAPKKTGMHQMSHRPDLYIFTQVAPVENTENNEGGVVLFSGTLETLGKWDVALRNLKVSIATSGPDNSSKFVSGYILLINHNAIQYIDSLSCDDLKECAPKGTATSAVYSFENVDCLIGKNATVIIEIKAKLKHHQNRSSGKENSLTAHMVWLGVEKIFRDPSGNVVTEAGKRLFSQEEQLCNNGKTAASDCTKFPIGY